MKKILGVFVISWVGALSLMAQPAPSILSNSVVNAASYAQSGMPNYGIAQGGTFILQGQNLGAKGVVVANSFPLQTSMGGTSMTIKVGGASVDALMIYVVAGQPNSSDQLAGIVPSNTPTGNGTITVTFNGRTSGAAPITIVANAFGIFAINQAGIGPGVFTDPNFRPNTLTNSAHAGDLMFIWGTGLGAINASDANAPPVGNLNVPVEVYVGNTKASIGYQGRSGCCSGIDQILITVPQGVTGCYVPVAVKTGNVVSNFTTMSIAASGNVCSDPTAFSVADLGKTQSGAALSKAEVSISRIAVTASIPGMGLFKGCSIRAKESSGFFRQLLFMAQSAVQSPVSAEATRRLAVWSPPIRPNRSSSSTTSSGIRPTPSTSICWTPERRSTSPDRTARDRSNRATKVVRFTSYLATACSEVVCRR